MWISNAVFKEDLDEISNCEFIPWDELKDQTVFITGATGLIGYTIASALLYYNLIHPCGIKVVALVRDVEKAREKFSEQILDGCSLGLVESTVESIPPLKEPIDYVIHCACPTASSYFVTQPVNTIRTIVDGTQAVLELARNLEAKGVVFLSSMEVYGEIRTEEKLLEADLGYIDLTLPRSCYPEAKRLAENLCCCYADQFQIPVAIARLAQTFGPGVNVVEEHRVFAYMARCASLSKDIRLETDGTKKSMYVYTGDAASAILLLLLRGKPGTAYNIANEETYCTVKEMACLVADELGEGRARVLTNAGSGPVQKYAPTGFLNLNTERIRALGWSPTAGLADMYVRMMAGV